MLQIFRTKRMDIVIYETLMYGQIKLSVVVHGFMSVLEVAAALGF